MAKLLTLSCLLNLYMQVNSQIIRSPPNFLSPNPYTDTIIELPRNVVDVPRNYIDVPRNYIDVPRNYIDVPGNFIDLPRNFIEAPRIIEASRNIIQPQPIIAEQPIIPISNIPTATTVITDCTPSVCKNLADTINLLVVSNLLQNTLGELKTLKMAASSLNNIMSNPALARCPGLISNLVKPNLIAPNVVSPNVIAPNAIAPKFVSSPNSIAANVPIGNGAMLSSLLKMIGNTV